MSKSLVQLGRKCLVILQDFILFAENKMSEDGVMKIIWVVWWELNRSKLPLTHIKMQSLLSQSNMND